MMKKSLCRKREARRTAARTESPGESLEPPEAGQYVDLLAGDRILVALVDRAWELGRLRSGRWLVCRVGCWECCIGPFPINRLDAWRLKLGLRELTARAPGRAGMVRSRAQAARTILARGFPGDARLGLLDPEEAARDAFFEAHSGLPCPALDVVSGRCDLYEYRPLPCRTFGLPVKTPLGDLPPCRLCFRGASPGKVNDCRVDFGGHEVEDLLLEGVTGHAAADDETVVAWALADR